MTLNCSVVQRVFSVLIFVGSGGRDPLNLYQDKKNKDLSNETTQSEIKAIATAMRTVILVELFTKTFATAII
jgi:hypothetical protein